ncbi:MAG: zinc-dependent peptidase [Gemmataceae bacterium]|nr:zinc-dependent peptidase [Gemmataceae bacterium]MCI0740127.1 zinc-dependent peptidase [Gemmataceae bacterium]
MVFTWLKNRRRKKLLALGVPDSWPKVLQSVAQYRLLPASERDKLLPVLRVFVAEKSFVGTEGLSVTEEMCVTVGALACILILGKEDFYFDKVATVLLTPKEFRAEERHDLGGEATLVEESEHLGEAYQDGLVRLSWADIRHEVEEVGRGCNLVYHEFAHQLDMLNGDMDGVPDVPRALQSRWQDTMAREYERLCDAADHNRPTLLDHYGANSEAEFFAVATECFFDQPVEMRHRHPDLYAVLSEYYRQDPAKWFS